MKVYSDIKQGTPEWLEVRKLKFTASHASTILARGKGVDTLIREMLTEYYSSGNYPEYVDRYTNTNIQRGNDFEDKARRIYELETGYTVTQVGFIEIDPNIGCSPDGLIDENGLLEIKNPNDKRFMELVMEDKIDKRHLDQMQMQMFVTGRAWCDYFCFNPNFETPFYMKRITADPAIQSALSVALPEAKRKLLALKKVLDKKMKGKNNEQ